MKTFPSGNDPFIFSDTLPASGTDTSQAVLDQHVNAFTVADFTEFVPADTASLFVTFIVFAYPNVSSSEAPPKVPIIEVLKRGVQVRRGRRGIAFDPRRDGRARPRCWPVGQLHLQRLGRRRLPDRVHARQCRAAFDCLETPLHDQRRRHRTVGADRAHLRSCFGRQP